MANAYRPNGREAVSVGVGALRPERIVHGGFGDPFSLTRDFCHQCLSHRRRALNNVLERCSRNLAHLAQRREPSAAIQQPSDEGELGASSR